MVYWALMALPGLACFSNLQGVWIPMIRCMAKILLCFFAQNPIRNCRRQQTKLICSLTCQMRMEIWVKCFQVHPLCWIHKSVHCMKIVKTFYRKLRTETHHLFLTTNPIKRQKPHWTDRLGFRIQVEIFWKYKKVYQVLLEKHSLFSMWVRRYWKLWDMHKSFKIKTIFHLRHSLIIWTLQTMDQNYRKK